MLSLEDAMGDRVYYGKEVIPQPIFSERLLGKYGAGLSGTTLIATADALGNKKNGIVAIQRVLKALADLDLPMKGLFLGFAGNTGSYKKGLLGEFTESFCIEQNPLNQDEYLGYNKAEEFVELIEEFEKIPSTDTFYLDIKTCSNLNHPYLCHSKSSGSRKFVTNFPCYKVGGLQDFITDHFGFYLNAKNYSGCTLKAGVHGILPADQIHESIIWLALWHSGCLQEEDIPDLLHHQDILKRCIPVDKTASFEVIFKYTLREDEFFRMIPGYENFQKIKIGEVLATSDGGSIVSQWDGRIFMPTYHTQCNDGFFVLKELA